MQQSNNKLYVRRVFIVDNCEELIPDYLNFVKGVVDPEDLPLNISREMLQQNEILKVIRKNIVKKCMELVEENAEDEDKYKKSYEQFSRNIELGIHEDSSKHKELTGYLRYYTSANETDKLRQIYLAYLNKAESGVEYIARLQSSIEADLVSIASETGQQTAKMRSCLSGLIKSFKQCLTPGNYDSPVMIVAGEVTQQLKEFDGKTPVYVTKESLELPDNEEEKKKMEKAEAKFEGLCKVMRDILVHF